MTANGQVNGVFIMHCMRTAFVHRVDVKYKKLQQITNAPR